jgi:hypothetical protein
MRHLYWGIIMLLGATMAQAADSLPVRVYPVPRAETPITLDGQLQEADWQKAPVVSGFTNYLNGELAPVQSNFRVLYDDQYLYFGIQNDEPKMDQLQAVAVPRDEHAIFRTEVMELFIDPGHTHDHYYQLAFNAAGSLYDGERESTHWNSNAVIAPHLGDDCWSVEVAVPWADLGGAVLPGRVIGFNLNRTRHLETASQYLTWTDVIGGFHDPARFAHLVLSGTPEMIGKMGPELRKGERHGTIQVYSAAGFSDQTYQQLAEAQLMEIDELLNKLTEQQTREESSAAAAELGQRLQEYRQQWQQFKLQAANNLSGSEWSRLEVGMQNTQVELNQVIWDARLSAVLKSF